RLGILKGAWPQACLPTEPPATVRSRRQAAGAGVGQHQRFRPHSLRNLRSSGTPGKNRASTMSQQVSFATRGGRAAWSFIVAVVLAGAIFGATVLPSSAASVPVVTSL